MLWFEHDLFDQLLLLQILERLPVDGGPTVTAVQPATYLGRQPASDYPALFTGRRPVSSRERVDARDAWGAFRSADPRTIVDVLPRMTALPHLAPALRRHLEQFPSLNNGLSRTEQQTLEAVANGPLPLRDLYIHSHHDREEAIFMGDAAFVFHISSLLHGSRPLLRTAGEAVELTDDGRRVLGQDMDRVATCGIDRWLGGVYLSGDGPVWRWDARRETLRVV